MSSGKRAIRSKVPLKAVMIYLTMDDAERVKKFADDRGLSVSKILREGMVLRMDRDGDPYEKGYNECLNDAIKVVQNTKGAQMMFPSGKSFAQLVCEGIEPLKRPVQHE
jgi:hypothetical protein